MGRKSHKFAHEQCVEVLHDEYPPTMEVVALLPGACETHDAPLYGCIHNGDHFQMCEAFLKELSPANRSKLN